MKKRPLGMLTLVVCASATVGCAAGEAPAQTPQTPPSAAAAPQPETKAKPPAGADASPGQTPSESPGSATRPGAATSEGTEPFRPDRPPREFITADDTAFSFDFDSSQIAEKTEKECRSKAGSDPQAYAACEQEARDEIGVNIHRFVKKHKTWWWYTYHRTGNRLVTIHKIPFKFGEETTNTIEIVPIGKDQGGAPSGTLPRKIVITIPNDYSIELTDPKHGRMAFSAKIGLVPK